jgi:hypothetical protein
MSTVPGPDTWSDAGLVEVDPDVPLRLADDADGGPDAADPEEYTPGFPRPDRDGAADEADVVEQDTEVPVGEDEVEG